MFSGGAAGWGTTCGALLAAGNVINMVTTLTDAIKIFNELIGWYTQTSLPTSHLEDIAKIKNQQSSISDSPLCHVSITRWCEASGFKIGTPDHSDRCAKITGDVAAHTVELLNAYAENRFNTIYNLPVENLGCMACHGKTGEEGNVISKMSCTGCHQPHETE